MIVDTSVLIAIVRREPEEEGFALKLLAFEGFKRISAGNVLEATIVLQRRGPIEAEAGLDGLLSELGIEIAPVDRDQLDLARHAFRRFGQASGHKARLNYGDCFAYALAMAMREPLLFKGDDFIHTDVRVA